MTVEARRRRLLGGIVAAALAVLFFGGGGIAGAQKPLTSRSKAKAEAARELSELMLPSGATRVSSDPSEGSVLRPPPIPTTNQKYAIDDTGFWRVPGKPSAVASWLRSQSPSGADGSFGGSPYHGVSSFGWTFRYSRAVVLQALDVEVAPAAGGGSAVRADGVAVWVPPHPIWDQIPASVHVMTVWRMVKGRDSGPVTFRNARRVQRVGRFLDDATLVPPIAVHGCPKGYRDSFRLLFQAKRPGPVLASSKGTASGCSYMTLTVDGRKGPALVGAYQLGPILDRLIRRGHRS